TNRTVDQPYKYYGIWVVDQWSKIGLKVTQRVFPTLPWSQALRYGNFDISTEGNCQNVVKPLTEVGKYLPYTIALCNYGYCDDALGSDCGDRRVHVAGRHAARARSRDAEARRRSDLPDPGGCAALLRWPS